MKGNGQQGLKFARHATIPPYGYACITLKVRHAMGDFAALPRNMIISLVNCKKCLQSEFMACNLSSSSGKRPTRPARSWFFNKMEKSPRA